MTLRSSVHLQLFEECIGPYLDFKLEKAVDVSLFLRHEFDIDEWLHSEFFEKIIDRAQDEDEYKNFIGSDYLNSVEVYSYMIEYVHAYREDFYQNSRRLDSYDIMYILPKFLYSYGMYKHYTTLHSRVKEIINITPQIR
jgi:hypothetical protein